MGKNVTVEELSNQEHRETSTGAPAQETFNARVHTYGQFRQDNVAANQAGVALAYQSIDAAALTSKVAERKGKILGVTWLLSAAITAGVATVRPTIAGTAVGDAVSIVSAAATAGVSEFATPVAFARGDKLGVKVTTDGSSSPTTSELAVDVIVRYDADDS